MVQIKICGITRVADAVAAARAGADAIGLVFVDASPRAVDLQTANEISRALPPFTLRVGLFMDPSVERVRAVLDALDLDRLQFHGSEPAAFCEQFGRPYIKAMAMGGAEPPDFSAHANASALLLDSHAPGEPGGTGRAFDWARRQTPARAWILAGGLNPGNVRQAVLRLQPPAVDVSSGVEASPGIKDDSLVRRFIEEARHG